jgi:hypothetical protein
VTVWSIEQFSVVAMDDLEELLSKK